MKARWEQVTSLFAAARELEPAQRDAFLAVACSDDQNLQNEVEALLAADVPDDGFLQNSPWAQIVRPPTATLQKGQLLKNRYRIDDNLAEGGQALVYRATDELLARSVVIKVMHAEGRRNRWLKTRFEREMKALASIDHPGVVGIIDVGELEDTSPFLVIQYIPGTSLRDVLLQGPIPPIRVAEITRQMASALHAAHALGIVHRDLKPENVMLLHSPHRANDTVKLIDFGIAKIDTDVDGTTTTVMLAGTVRYMAPEQFEGKHSISSDIYSMALIVCEMLGGHPDIRALSPSTPPKVRRALEGALAFRPEDRPTDVRSWSEGLARNLGTPAQRRLTIAARVASLSIILVGTIAAPHWIRRWSGATGGTDRTTLAAPSSRITGRWNVEQLFLENTGQPNAKPYLFAAYEWELTQTGNTITGVITAGPRQGTITGTLSGNAFTGTMQLEFDPVPYRELTLVFGPSNAIGTAVYTPVDRAERHRYRVTLSRAGS